MKELPKRHATFLYNRLPWMGGRVPFWVVPSLNVLSEKTSLYGQPVQAMDSESDSESGPGA